MVGGGFKGPFYMYFHMIAGFEVFKMQTVFDCKQVKSKLLAYKEWK